MDGPGHFAKAEFCFAEADRGGPSYEDAGLWLDLGIGHALLAIAAVLAQQLADRYRGDGPHVNAWSPTWTPTVDDSGASDAPQAVGDWFAAQDAETTAERAAEAEWGPA